MTLFNKQKGQQWVFNQALQGRPIASWKRESLLQVEKFNEHKWVEFRLLVSNQWAHVLCLLGEMEASTVPTLLTSADKHVMVVVRGFQAHMKLKHVRKNYHEHAFFSILSLLMCHSYAPSCKKA